MVKLHNTRRSAGQERIISYHNFSDVYCVERVNVLEGGNALDYFFFIYLLRQRKLNKYTVNVFVIVERVDKLEKLFFGSLLGECVFI